MRFITVAGVVPARKPCIAVTMAPGSRPMRRGTSVLTALEVAWQPEQERAPGGASASPAEVAGATRSEHKMAAASIKRVPVMSEHPFSGSPQHYAPASGLSQIMFLE